MHRTLIFIAMLMGMDASLSLSSRLHAAVCNLKVVTDASPDYSDLPSLVRSVTGQWATPEEKCLAMFHWNHIARRQTQPMHLHGMALTDPIRQFNDYGYTMCSTISGINCSLWEAMGFKSRYWDISMHTVAEVEYGGRWHMYDNSMTALYTLCDGKTIAGVEDIGRAGACAASGGKTEPGHIARYHCLMATSPRGFLTGADTIRSLDEEYRCFNPNGLKYRSYFYDWDRGHRYRLNLRDQETYARHYRSLGNTPDFYVPNNGKDPEQANPRYRIRGNGLRVFKPDLAGDAWQSSATWHSNVVTGANNCGLTPARAGEAGVVVFKVEGANVLTSLKIRGRFQRQTERDENRIHISTVNGLAWKEVWRNGLVGENPMEIKLVEEVNGTYEVLVKIELLGQSAGAAAQLRELEFEAVTMLNSKTQPRLLLGKNTVYVGAGDNTESIVFWPDLRGEHWKPYAVEHHNLAAAAQHPGYQGVMHAVAPKQDAWVVFRVDAPRAIVRFEYGGRLYNRAPGSRIEFLHSFDAGQTWSRTYSLTNTAQPWDVIHYETVTAVPAGARSVWFKYLLHGSAAGREACSLYAVRMEVQHEPLQSLFKPVAVTFNWSERQPDYSLRERSHTEVVNRLPHRYQINVGGADHPVVNSLVLGPPDASLRPGYSDGRDVGGEKFVGRWQTAGRNLALGKPYTVSVPSLTQWDAGDPEGKKLTDGIVGPPYPGGTAPRSALCWNKGQNPEINVDLGRVESCGAFRIQVGAGYPWWDALKAQIKDQVEVLTSRNGVDFQSHGFFNFHLRWKDLPENHYWPDEEVIAAHNFELIPPTPVTARHVRYKITPARAVTVSEVEVLEHLKYEPFDWKLTLPDEPAPFLPSAK